MDITHIEDAKEFEAEVLDEKGPVVVDFWASWCGPCMMMAPELERLAKTFPDVKVVKANVDTMQETAISYQIDSIPCFILFEDGKVKKRTVGAMPMEALASMLGL